MTTSLYRSAATWAAIGLAGGLFYRTLTHSRDFEGRTQLAVVHTHALVLGMVTLLAVLALDLLLDLGADLRGRWALRLWNAGLAVTTGAMLTKGTLQVTGHTYEHPALAGVAGIGHIALTAAVVLLFLAVGARLRARGDDAALPASQRAYAE